MRPYFYRDSNGNEVDLVLSHGPKWIPIEINSAATVRPALLNGIPRFMRVVPDAVEPRLVYDGDFERTQHGVRIVNWRGLQSELAHLRT